MAPFSNLTMHIVKQNVDFEGSLAQVLGRDWERRQENERDCEPPMILQTNGTE